MAAIRIYAKPTHLHRYRPLGEKREREIRALRNGYVWCPSFGTMNDPMEGSHRLSSRFRKYISASRREQQVTDILREMGIASFSEVYDHEPMWAHYADQFKGMCVQYSLAKLLKSLPEEAAITRMMYSEREPVLLADKSSTADRARLCLSSKSVRWASEREWRVFQDCQGEAAHDPGAITKIFLGARVSDDDAAAVIAVARELNVPVAKMEIEAYSIAFKTMFSARRAELSKAVGPKRTLRRAT